MKKVFPKGTIVIDRYLLRNDQSGRRRFTLAHEAAHLIYERMTPLVPGPCFKRGMDKERSYNVQELKKRMNLGETQVDRLASVLLMPSFQIERVLREFRVTPPLPVYGENVIRGRDKLAIQKMADAVGVSYSAFVIRLRDLGFVQFRPIEEYLDLEMSF